MAATIPDSGIVTNHAMTIERATPQFTALIRLEAPTPNKEPLTTCVVLTGMGADGTNGIKALSRNHKNIYVIAQDEETSVVYGMPKAIANTGLVNEVVPLNHVAEAITKNVGVS